MCNIEYSILYIAGIKSNLHVQIIFKKIFSDFPPSQKHKPITKRMYHNYATSGFDIYQ